jgi:predicted heme/steroid binding protein
MTKEELSKHDGKDGRAAYIGYNGKVYDVTENKFWKGGEHFRTHDAGCDLTEMLKKSPHEEAVFEGREPICDLEL